MLKPDEIFSRPLARMILNKDKAKDLLDGNWELFTRSRMCFKPRLLGKALWSVVASHARDGARINSSWHENDWPLKRFNRYQVIVKDEDKKKLDRDISGDYAL